MKKPCNVISITSLRESLKPQPPEPIATAKKKPYPRRGGTSRRDFLASLLTTLSWEKAKRRTGVRDPYATEIVCDALFEAGYSPNALRFPMRKKDAA